MRKYRLFAFVISICLVLILSVVGFTMHFSAQPELNAPSADSLDDIPKFSDVPYIELNGNIPEFSSEDIVAQSYESYSTLDSLGRCGVATACIGFDILPTAERESIGQIKPTGWQTVKYDNIDGKYLYNRCHLIGYQLTGENANEKNLITGTRYMNVEGMLPFENMVGDYVRETLNHVIYRVTPVFEGDELIARGVKMEALSVEDDGDGICFNVFVYNCQPGIDIDYSNGDSACVQPQDIPADKMSIKYVLNTNTKKVHMSNCFAVSDISEKNREIADDPLSDILAQGYKKCQACYPE